MVVAARLVAMLWVSVVACAAGPTRVRSGVDPEAMREAMEASEPSRYTSSRAYLHYMRGTLARYEGDNALAAEEFREALVYDPDSPHLRTVLADELASSGELERALIEVQAALTREPGFSAAHLLAAKVYLAKKQQARAVAALEKAIATARHCAQLDCDESEDADREAYRTLWSLYIDSGQDAKAEVVVERYSKLHEEDPSGYFSLARGLLAKKPIDAEKAESLLQRALVRAPSSTEILKELAELLAARRNLPEAIATYERALRREPDDGRVLYALGLLHLRLRQDADARAYYDQLMNLDPDSADNPLYAARAYLASRRHKLALEAVEVAEHREPRGRRVAFVRGLVRQDMGDFAGAALLFAQTRREDEDWDMAQLRMGYCLSRAGSHDESLLVLARHAAERPDHPEALVTLAEAYQRAGRTGHGIELLEKSLLPRPQPELAQTLSRLYQAAGRTKDAIALILSALDGTSDPEQRDSLLYALGNAHERAGDALAAVAAVRQVLERNPDDPRAMNFIGYTLAERKLDMVEAARLLERAWSLRPEDGYIADSLGWLYYQKGEFAKAVELLTRADELSPTEPVILSHLGDALLKLERARDAQDAFERAQRALVANPDPEVERALVGKLRELSQRMKFPIHAP